MTPAAMDGPVAASYLRGVRSKRPSPAVILATVVAGCVLAAGGYILGRGSGRPGVPARVQLRSLPQPTTADPIPVPANVDLPPR